jgi:hypothetical protein
LAAPTSTSRRRKADVSSLPAAIQQAWQTIVKAQSVSERSDEHSWDAELHRIAGESVKGADAGERYSSTPSKLHVDKAQRASSFEIRVALNLARLLRGKGRNAEARELASPILGLVYRGLRNCGPA